MDLIDILLHDRYQGHIGAALVLGGIDATGPHLYTVYPHGSTDKLPYVTMGSGSLAAMSVFESRWKADMTVRKEIQENGTNRITDTLSLIYQREEAIELVKDAIEAGIFNDLGSGSNVDVCVIEKDKTDYLRNYARPNERGVKEQSYRYPRGTTAVLKQSITNFVDVSEGDAMDLSM